jgi:hypothetical protein
MAALPSYLIEPKIIDLFFITKYDLSLMAFDLRCAYHIGEDLGNFIVNDERTENTFNESQNQLCARAKVYWKELQNIEDGDFASGNTWEWFERKVHKLQFGY